MISILLFLSTFAVYLFSLPPTIPAYRDSGDLIASAATLGIAHPPAYPLYVLLTHLLVGVMHWGNVAYRVNVVSALMAALSVAILYEVLNPIFRPGLTAPYNAFARPGLKMDVGNGLLFLPAILALWFAFTPAVWSLAHVAEMYTMGAFWGVCILLCFLTPYACGVFLGSFLLGLGLGIHPTLIFLAVIPVVRGMKGQLCPHPHGLPSPSLHIPLSLGGAEGRDPSPSLSQKGRGMSEGMFSGRSVIIYSLLLFLLGLSVFLFLPLRARLDPLQNWGHPTTWRYFWRVITRADYGGLKLHPVESELAWTPDSIGAQLVYFVRALRGQWTWVGIALGAWALLTLQVSWGILFAFILVGPAFFVLSNLPLQEATTPAILEPYMVLANVLWAVIMAMGVVSLTARRSIAVAFSLAMAAFLIFVVVHPKKSLPSCRHDFYAYDYGRNLMHSLPPQAVLYDPDDPTAFTVRTLQISECRRPDIVLLNFFRTRWGYEDIRRRWPDLLPPIPIANARDLEQMLWTYSIGRRPFYVELPQKLEGQHPYVPEGLVYRVLKPDEGLGPSAMDRGQILFQLYVKRGDFSTVDHADFFTQHLMDYYSAAYSNTGLAYAERHEDEAAVRQYQQALLIDPHLTAAYNNWAILYYQEHRYAEAIALYREALHLQPDAESIRRNLELAQREAMLKSR